MAWNAVQPLLPDLMLLQARMERLRLVDKLCAAEMHMRAAGLDVSELARVRQNLLAKPMALDKPIFTATPPPKQADGTQRLRYLMVSEPRRV